LLETSLQLADSVLNVRLDAIDRLHPSRHVRQRILQGGHFRRGVLRRKILFAERARVPSLKSFKDPYSRQPRPLFLNLEGEPLLISREGTSCIYFSANASSRLEQLSTLGREPRELGPIRKLPVDG